MSQTKTPSQTIDAAKVAKESLQIVCEQFSPFGCSSATMFIRDPLLPYYLRLVADWGVELREVMHGPLSVHSTIGSIMMEPVEVLEVEWFLRDVLTELKNSVSKSSAPVGKHHPLYDGFIERENVASAALLRFIIRGEIQACIWVNFSKPIDRLSKRLQNLLRRFKKTISKLIPELLQQLASQVPGRIRRFEKLHAAAKHFPTSTSGATLESYLQDFLGAALDVCGIGDEGFGTIYLSDEMEILRKVAQRGLIAKNAKTSFSVSQREGLVSVAAARGTPLIVDQPQRKFPENYISIEAPSAPPTTREVIVPLVVANKVIGMMNLETKQEEPKFNELDVFDLSAAGFRVASSIRVSEQTSKTHQDRTMTMLEIASRAISDTEPIGMREDLQSWAQVAFGADLCSIWRWCSVGQRFVPDNRPESPRDRGISQFIKETHCIVWCSDSGDPEALDAVFWNDKVGQWSNVIPTHTWLPEGVNSHLIGDEITHQLGMPILFQDKCVGVVWFKFRDSAMIAPLLSRIQLAKGLTAEIGLILQLKRRHEEFVDDVAVQRKLHELYAALFPTGAFTCEAGEGYVIVQSCGPIGGDFYAKVDLKDSTGFIVGDGENHGFVGATAMLPMYTAFKICAQNFLSPRHTLWQMSHLLEGLDDVRGSAISFVVDGSRGTPRLIVSSAAHPKIMVFGTGKFESLPKGDAEGFQLGVGHQMYYDNLLDESQYDLATGDMVVAITDGVVDAGENGIMGRFGVDRISTIVLQARNRGPEAVAKAIKEGMLKHCDNVLFDDYTILVIRIS